MRQPAMIHHFPSGAVLDRRVRRWGAGAVMLAVSKILAWQAVNLLAAAEVLRLLGL